MKWPNDVLINGKKIAGILLEVFDSYVEEPSVIVGIGINISKVPEKLEYPATCINEYNSGHISVDDVLISLLHHFVCWFHIWEDFGFGAIKDEWMRRAFKLNGSVSVENQNGVVAQYKFRGIDMEGAMLLDDENGNAADSSRNSAFFIVRKVNASCYRLWKYKHRLCRVYENTNCVGSWRTSTNISRTADEYAVWLTELLALRGLVINDIKGIIIANVVPETSFNLINLCEKYFEIRPMVVGETEVDLGIT